MFFQFGRYSSLLLIFFVHGLVYAVMLYQKGVNNETRSDKWLSFFLVLCILYIAPWMVGFGGWYDKQPYRDILFYTPFQHLFLIGPVIFFYVQSLLNPSFKFTKKHWLHFLPGLLYLLFSVTMVVADKLILKRYFFLANGADPDFDTWYQVLGFISMLGYFYASLRYYNGYKRFIVQVISYADKVMFTWVHRFLLAFFCMLLLRLAFFIGGIFVEGGYTDLWWYFFMFAIIFYYIAITGYANSVEAKVAYKPNLLVNKPQLLIGFNSNNESFIEDAEVIEINSTQKTDEGVSILKDKILQEVVVNKLYEDPELSLSQLAKVLKTNASVLSKSVNQGFLMNFNDFINHYRVNAVIEKLKAGEHKTQTLLGIAYDCGFNSKATFNRAFKKATNLSPKDWIEKMDKNSL